MTRYFASTLIGLALLSASVSAKTLTEISLEGVSKGEERQVLAQVPLKIGENISQTEISRAVRQLYKTKKYRTVAVSAINETDSSTGVQITLEFNPYCDGVEFHGNKKLTKTKMKELITIQNGELLTDAKIYEYIVKIKDAYKEKGYLQAEINCDLVPTSVPNYVIAKFTIKEHDKVRVETITFSGNTAFPEKKVRRKFKTKERHMFSSGEYDEVKYRGHLDTLMQFYKEEGYLESRIVSDTVVFKKDSSGLVINIVIEEGRQFFVGDFYFRNNKVIDTYRLAEVVTMRRGKPFSALKFQETQSMVGNVYRNEGYLWSQLIPTYKYRGDTVDVVFDITEGNPAIIRKIDIAGNDKTREQVIRRELVIYPGQKYNQSLMERSIREVRQLNYFDNVTPDIAPNQDGSIDLVFDVKEKENIGQFSAGVTYSAQESFGGNFSVSIPNFRGAGEQLDAMAEIAQGRKNYSLGFTEPWIFNTPIQFNARAFYTDVQSKYDSRYDYRRIGTEFGLGRKLKWPDDYFYGSAKYLISYDKNSYTNPSVEDKLGIDIVSKGILSRLYLSLIRNDTDIPQFPTRGSIFTIGSYLGGLGGDYSYLKGILSYDWYQPLGKKLVLGAKTKFGMVGSMSSDIKLGYNDLFQVGGVYYDGVVRGYDETSIGTDLMMMTLSSELRFPIIDQQFYLGGFFDMGNSWNKLEQVNIGEMYKGVGLGVRLMLPMVGLLGFDFGWPLDVPKIEESKFNTDYKFSGKPEFYFIMNRGF